LEIVLPPTETTTKADAEYLVEGVVVGSLDGIVVRNLVKVCQSEDG